MNQYQFTGTWITRDGFIKKVHFPDGKFGETDRTGKAFKGQYTLKEKRLGIPLKKKIG